MAVRAAVMAATNTLSSTSQMFLLFMVVRFIKFITSVDYFLIKKDSAFLPCHCSYEPRPVLFCESLQASVASPEADIPDVSFCVVLGGRSPSADDVADAVGMVFRGVCAEQDKCGSNAPFKTGELHENRPPSPL